MNDVIWAARKWAQDEIVSLLKNDDTPIAVYAHQTRDAMLEMGRRTGITEPNYRACPRQGYALTQLSADERSLALHRDD